MPLDLSPLWISLKTALLATAITFFLGIAAAYWMLEYRGKGRSLIEGLFVSPLVLPPTVVGFLLLLLLGKNSPFTGFLPANFTVVFTWYAAVIAATVVAFPLMYKTALGAFEQIDSNLLQVARTLGASEWIVFRRILLPLSIPGILAGTTLAFARALGEFGATLMLAGNIPGETQTIPMAIYFAVEGGAIAEASFWTLLIIGISLSGIMAVNFWQATGRKWEKRSAKQTVGVSSQRRGQQPIAAKPQNSSGLAVAIQKHLSSFYLDVSFSVENQQALGFLGASGAGKSMVLRCIAGIEAPTKGQIVLNGRVLFDSANKINVPSRDRRIGFLVQNYGLFPHLTVAQNIAFGLPKSASLKLRQQVDAQLVAMQLQGFGDRYPNQLSGGQQQRVAFARALASQPEALLLDEPFSALDAHLRSYLEQQMIARLADYSGVTLFVTHNLEEAYRVCPNLLIMEQGKAIASGNKHDIFEQPGSVSVARLTGCKNFSNAATINAHQIKAIDWDCTLQVIHPIPKQLAQIGIRAHQIRFVEASTSEANSNTFFCWLAATSETPHRITLFLKLHSVPTHPQDYHLQAEVFKEKWTVLEQRSFPWQVYLDPMRLILLE